MFKLLELTRKFIGHQNFRICELTIGYGKIKGRSMATINGRSHQGYGYDIAV